MREDREISRFRLPRATWILVLIVTQCLWVAGGLEAAQPSWSAPTNLPHAMTVYFELTDSSGNSLSATNSQLAVFNGSNVAGVAQLSDGPRGPIFQVVVWSATPTITGLTLQLYNGATDGIWTLTNTINFQSGRRGSVQNAVAAPQSQTIIFPAMGSINYSTGLTTNLSATSSSGLEVTYSTTNTNLISISSNVVTVLGVGTATIVASQSGSSNYLTALPVTNTLVIEKGAASISFSGTNAMYDGTAKSVTSITTPSNLAVGVIYNGSSNAPSNAGSYSVVGVVNDQNYTGSNSTTLVIAKASNAVSTFTPISTQTFSSNATVSISVPASSSGLPANLSVVSGPATLIGNTLTLTGPGTVVLAAEQVGDSNYMPASRVTTSFTVSAAVTPVKVPVIYIEGSTGFRSGKGIIDQSHQ